MCAFGEDVSEMKVKYQKDGKLTQVKLSYALRETLHQLVDRLTHLHVFFFPFLANVFITQSERDTKANAGYLRELIAEIVRGRRAALEADPSLKEAGNFLTILLTEPYFMNDSERIIDECLTFFFAGSQTSAIAS